MNPRPGGTQQAGPPGSAAEPGSRDEPGGAAGPSSMGNVGRLRPRRRWIWITVAMLVAAASVAPVGLRIWLKAAYQTETGSAVLRHPITAIHVDAPADSVTVSPGAAGRVTVGRTLTWVFSKPRIRETWSGQALTIRASCPPPDTFEDCGVHLELRVPADVAVTAGVTSGSLAVRGINGSLHLDVTSGTVSMAAAPGPVWVSATSGSISGTRLDSAQVGAAAGSGSITLSFAGPPQQVSARVGSGSLSILLPRGYRYRVGGTTGSGSRSVEPALVDPGSGRIIDATSGSGAVAVSYPNSG